MGEGCRGARSELPAHGPSCVLQGAVKCFRLVARRGGPRVGGKGPVFPCSSFFPFHLSFLTSPLFPPPSHSPFAFASLC